MNIFMWVLSLTKACFTNGGTKLRQPWGLGSLVSSAWDVLLLKPGAHSLPHVEQDAGQGLLCGHHC